MVPVQLRPEPGGKCSDRRLHRNVKSLNFLQWYRDSPCMSRITGTRACVRVSTWTSCCKLPPSASIPSAFSGLPDCTGQAGVHGPHLPLLPGSYFTACGWKPSHFTFIHAQFCQSVSTGLIPFILETQLKI